MKGSYLGPEFTQNQIEKNLNQLEPYMKSVNYEKLINQTSEHLSKEKSYRLVSR
jgi:carbamoyltransferase